MVMVRSTMKVRKVLLMSFEFSLLGFVYRIKTLLDPSYKSCFSCFTGLQFFNFVANKGVLLVAEFVKMMTSK